MEKKHLSDKNVHFISNVHFNSKPADIILNKGQDIKVEDKNSIVTTNTVDEMNLNPISYDDVKIGMWVITIYENEKWLGNVVHTKMRIKFVFVVWKNHME